MIGKILQNREDGEKQYGRGTAKGKMREGGIITKQGGTIDVKYTDTQ